LASFDFALVRYNGDGSLDETFGIGGKVLTDFDLMVDSARAIAIQPTASLLL
jgi:hypothetical protein